jgi:hypothetical protein
VPAASQFTSQWPSVSEGRLRSEKGFHFARLIESKVITRSAIDPPDQGVLPSGARDLPKARAIERRCNQLRAVVCATNDALSALPASSLPSGEMARRFTAGFKLV